MSDRRTLGRQTGPPAGQVCNLSGNDTCVSCDNDDICDSNESCGCPDCSGDADQCPIGQSCATNDTGLCIACDLDTQCEAGEGCDCTECLGQQNGCPAGQVCDLSGNDTCVSCRSEEHTSELQSQFHLLCLLLLLK